MESTRKNQIKDARESYMRLNNIITTSNLFTKGYGDKWSGQLVCSGGEGNNTSVVAESDHTPTLVLDDECLKTHIDLLIVMGGGERVCIRITPGRWLCIKKVSTISNSVYGRIVWVEIEGIPFKLWSNNTFKRIASKWGDLLHIDDQDENCFHSKRLCIKTKVGKNIIEAFKIIFRGKVCWIRAKEVTGWVPDFLEESDDEHDSDDDVNEGDLNAVDSDVDEVLETCILKGWYRTFCNNGENSKKECGEFSQGGHEEGGVSYRKKDVTVSDYFIMIRGVWLKTGCDLLIVSVYAPQELNEKKILWDYLTHVINNWKEGRGANVFNSFIVNAGLEEIPLGGCSFTWCHKSATKMSKLDRFLISENLMITWPELHSNLSRNGYILRSSALFCFAIVSLWIMGTPSDFFSFLGLKWKDFNKLVEDAWNEAPVDESNAMSNMMKKLKYLKQKIRDWNKGNMKSSKNIKAKLKDDLKAVDDIIDNGGGNDEVVNLRLVVLISIQDYRQEFTHWDADSKSKSLHINMNKSKLMGVLVDDEKVKQAASKLGCLILKPPFSYLGSKVGGSMHRIQAWNEVVDRVYARLSKWKMKRFNWRKEVLCSNGCGGSLLKIHLYGRGLSRRSMENDGKVGKQVKSTFPSYWMDIVHEINVLKNQDLYPVYLCSRTVQTEALLVQVRDVNLVPVSDRWKWSLENSGDFSVASVRKMLDDKMFCRT
ncbi:RNA-directed DNA polymerase, eukaryota, reverse transcriptase zinc-binding domain protein [Tanacetum coccineum]